MQDNAPGMHPGDDKAARFPPVCGGAFFVNKEAFCMNIIDFTPAWIPQAQTLLQESWAEERLHCRSTRSPTWPA